MIDGLLKELAYTIKVGLGLNHVFYSTKCGIGTEYINYGYIRLLDDEARKYSYKRLEEGCTEYEIEANCVLVLDLEPCARSSSESHDIIVAFMMQLGCVDIKNSGDDACAIFKEETDSDKYWESDNYLIAVWFTYRDEVDMCGVKNQNYCLL